MSRTARLAGAVLIVLLGLPAAAQPVEIVARRVPLERDEPGRTRAGPLEFRGGLHLTSPDPRFGGLSGLLISADGTRMSALSDAGHWLTARLRYEETGRLAGLAGAAIGVLRGPGGAPLHGKRERDAEALARLPDGSLAVSFERNHRIWRYPAGAEPLRGAPSPLPGPPGLERLRRNSGIEALATLADGALLAVVEGAPGDRESPAYLWRGGAWRVLRYRRHGRFRPSGATRLPDGGLLLIERRFNVIDGLAVRLRRIPAESVRAGAILEGEEIAVLRPPLSLDNLEGVAARRSAAGRTLVYLVSDDNFNPLQRTLLLVFALMD